MSQRRLDISVLLFCENEELRNEITIILRPRCRSLVIATSLADCAIKLRNQEFKAVFYRSDAPTIMDPKGPFIASLKQKTGRSTLWALLGSDVEKPSTLNDCKNIEVLEDYKNEAVIGDFLSTSFDVKATAAASNFDVGVVNTIVRAATEHFARLKNLKLERGELFIKSATSKTDNAAPSTIALIAIETERFRASLALYLPHAVIAAALPSATDAEHRATEAMRTAMELFNDAKKDLENMGYSVKDAKPQVLKEGTALAHHEVQGACIGVPFVCPQGKIVLEYVVAFGAVRAAAA